MVAHLQRLKKAGTIAATFACALLIGFVMQYGDADASRFSDPSSAELRKVLPAQLDTSPLARATVMDPKIPAPVQLNANPLDAVRLDAGSVKLTALVSEVAQSTIDEALAIVEPLNADETPSCRVDFTATPDEQATVALSIYSFCRPEMSFSVAHEGLEVTGLTDLQGRADIVIPALTADAAFLVTFNDGGTAASAAVVPEAADFNRIVLQWKGAPAQLIRQYEREAGQFGTLARLGSETGADSRFAEVFSFPATYPVAEGLKDLTVQAEVSEQTCGQVLAAQTFRVQPDLDSKLKDIRITLPGCEHVGTFLELKKVLGGQTLLQ